MAFETIRQVEDYFYGSGDIAQADDPFLTSTTGALNRVYGAKVWSQLNQTANTWGVLPKYPWQNSGYRALTARAASSGGGIAEGGAVPETIKPTFVEIDVDPAEVAHSFEISMRQDALDSGNDDTLGYDELQSQMATHHAEMLNVMLHTDVDTLPGDNMESIDRVVSSNGEVSDGTIALDAGDSDIYGIDRDSGASWADAYVDHNSGTDRQITDELIRSLIENTEENGANRSGQVFITGFDTANQITGLYESQVRYNPIGEAYIEPSVNGYNTGEGMNAGQKVVTLYTRPIIEDKDVVKDTISRLYLLDISDPNNSGRPRLGISVLSPTLYFETKEPFQNNKFTREGLYYTSGQLVCTFFAAQGKIRDLK